MRGTPPAAAFGRVASVRDHRGVRRAREDMGQGRIESLEGRGVKLWEVDGGVGCGGRDELGRCVVRKEKVRRMMNR